MIRIKRQILVVADDLAICQALYDNMQDDFTDVCPITSTVEALVSYLKRDYCLVILDIHLSNLDSVQLLQTMQKEKCTPILVLTDFWNADDWLALYKAGANACIERTQNIEVCVAQANALIKLHVRADICHSPHDLISFGSELIIIPRYRQAIVDGNPLTLTKKEFDLLHYFASSPEQVFTKEQLYDCIWNERPAIAVDEVVKSHIKRLRKKLALVGKKYIQTEWGVGYKFVLSTHKS